MQAKTKTMKNLIWGFTYFLILTISIGCLSAQTKNERPKKNNEIVFLTYNVRNCFGVDNKVDYQRVAEIIKRINPQAVALQELDSATQRSGEVVVLDTLAALTKMYHVYGPSINYLGGKYGIGVLTKDKPLSWKTVSLPGREEKRSLLIVELEDYIFCCTHLSLNPDDRLRSVEIINDLFKESSKPIFLAGDLNSLPNSAEIQYLENKWLMLNNPKNPTIPSDYPRRCIDYIFAFKNKEFSFKTEKSIVENEQVASDHRPIWVMGKIKK